MKIYGFWYRNDRFHRSLNMIDYVINWKINCVTITIHHLSIDIPCKRESLVSLLFSFLMTLLFLFPKSYGLNRRDRC